MHQWRAGRRIRKKAVDFVTGVLTSTAATSAPVCKGYGAGPTSGTTCTFLPH
jgi:hypothetical protein